MPTLLRGLHRASLLMAMVLLAASTAVAVLALATARGVTQLNATTYSTEFISNWWLLAFLLAPVPVISAGWRPREAAVQTAALVVPQFAAATVCIARYRSSEWASGLEVLAYLHPLLLTGLTGGLVGLRLVIRRG